MPGVTVRVQRAFAVRIRAVPHDLLGPGQVREHVLAAKTVDARRLREEAALAVEDALPRVKEHVSARIYNGQIVVRCLYYRVQVLDPAKDSEYRRSTDYWDTLVARDHVPIILIQCIGSGRVRDRKRDKEKERARE